MRLSAPASSPLSFIGDRRGEDRGRHLLHQALELQNGVEAVAEGGRHLVGGVGNVDPERVREVLRGQRHLAETVLGDARVDERRDRPARLLGGQSGAAQFLRERDQRRRGIRGAGTRALDLRVEGGEVVALGRNRRSAAISGVAAMPAPARAGPNRPMIGSSLFWKSWKT